MVRCLEAAFSMQVIGIDSATSAMVIAETRKARKHPGWIQLGTIAKGAMGSLYTGECIAAHPLL